MQSLMNAVECGSHTPELQGHLKDTDIETVSKEINEEAYANSPSNVGVYLAQEIKGLNNFLLNVPTALAVPGGDELLGSIPHFNTRLHIIHRKRLKRKTLKDMRLRLANIPKSHRPSTFALQRHYVVTFQNFYLGLPCC